ncbi:hypothetical protein RBSH_05942 [Rhodopirellula baltica SH28]|uniref:Uncharacterized protein n=3 Tax=Rhodopirellula baltica TaxID=265606 RepID=F2ATZ6_RHOBT|nr:hypothetical protein RBWH47_04019 [Rhodopirellula baltica WH47]EKJ98749.1 hypothetical protein RBSH_05942 [Rhodopirellula baltica SH28]ELP32087.1 hypothetical protein RBSWK_03786 [Rhodopirellula baltica SWK14]
MVQFISSGFVQNLVRCHCRLPTHEPTIPIPAPVFDLAIEYGKVTLLWADWTQHAGAER